MASTVLQLDPNSIMTSIEVLGQRIEERFPGAGLAHVCRELLAVARQASERSAAIARPTCCCARRCCCCSG